MMACGYAPSNAIDAMTTIADEYGTAYCYHRNNAPNDEQ
jgi:hypothetical protein